MNSEPFEFLSDVKDELKISLKFGWSIIMKWLPQEIKQIQRQNKAL